jgi:SAM-dependent methyltransferase
VLSAATLNHSPPSASDHVVFSAALRGEPCHVVGPDSRLRRLPSDTWRQAAGAGDRVVLGHCIGATLDIGCGPGRMVQHLAAQGGCVLGIDVVPEAVTLTRERGGSALLRDVFDPLPAEGRWDTALLADGNIGIGGDPVRLLRRVHNLLSAPGRTVVDLGRPGVGVLTASLHLVCGERRSSPFPWSFVGVDAVRAIAAAAAFMVEELHEYDGRWFAVLGKQW